MLKRFVIGRAVAVWWGKDAITAKIDARMRAIRRTIASRPDAMAETIEHGFEGGPRDDARARIPGAP